MLTSNPTPGRWGSTWLWHLFLHDARLTWALASAEMICIPCKLIFGNYVKALKAGADALIMFGGQGTCT